MLRYLGFRFALSIPALLAVTLVTFFIGYYAPGDPVTDMLGLHATEENTARLKAEYGLDRPPLVQYWSFLSNAMRGDFGLSYRFRGRPVTEIIADGLAVTAQLGLLALIVAVALGIPAGIIAALNRGRPLDYITMSLALAVISVPAFVLAPILILLLAVKHPWLPVGGWGDPIQLVMPAFVLGSRPAGLLARMMRSSMLEVLNQDYIRTARAKGLRERAVILRHALRNALLPVVTVLANSFGYLVTGSFIIETIYDIPGIGRIGIESIFRRDYPVIQATVLLMAVTFVLVNLMADLIYGLLDPRVRVGARA